MVRHTSRWWESVHAARERRAPRRLLHAALEVAVDGDRHVIEMAPAWGVPAAGDRGVVATGPVGLRWLGRSRFFRYEVRRWRDGVIADRRWAVGGPMRVAHEDAPARAILRSVEQVPILTWGRDALGIGDMWNSNSLVSWLLVAGAGIDAATVGPPDNGRAPGWAAGIELARHGSGR